MSRFGKTPAKAMRSLLAIALLALAPPAWPQKYETLPRYDVDVTITPEASSLSVQSVITLPASPEPRKSLQFNLLPSMGTPQVQLLSPATAGALAFARSRMRPTN